HRLLVIAPEPASGTARVAGPLPYPVVRVPSVPMPGYPTFRLGLPSRRIADALLEHGTDVVHLGSPFLLGARGRAVAQGLCPPPPQRRRPARAGAQRRDSGRVRRAAGGGEAGRPAGPDPRYPGRAAGRHRWRPGRAGAAQGAAGRGVPRTAPGLATRPALREP